MCGHSSRTAYIPLSPLHLLSILYITHVMNHFRPSLYYNQTRCGRCLEMTLVKCFVHQLDMFTATPTCTVLMTTCKLLPNYDTPLNSEHNEGEEEGNTVCGRPGQKSNIIPLCISSTLPCSKCCVTKLPLKAGLIHASYRLMTN